MTATEGFLSPTIANHAIDSARASAATAREAGAMDLALARVLHSEEIQKKDAELLEAKKALHGQVAIKDALKAALAEVAPDHELNKEAVRVQIRDEAKAKVTPDSPWWPHEL